MTALCICSGKGGTGKTTLAANLAAAISKLGREVLVIDADIEMANLCFHFGMEGAEITLHEVLAGEAHLDDAIRTCPSSGVAVLPAGIALEKLRRIDLDRMERVLEALNSGYDVVLIDAPAGLGRPVLTALSCSDAAMLVVNPEIPSLSDALKIKAVATKLGTSVLGAVINRYRGTDEDLSVQEIETVLDTRVLAVIPEDPQVRPSTAFGTPFVLRSPESQASQAVMKLAADLIGEEYTPPRKSFRERIRALFAFRAKPRQRF